MFLLFWCFPFDLRFSDVFSELFLRKGMLLLCVLPMRVAQFRGHRTGNSPALKAAPDEPSSDPAVGYLDSVRACFSLSVWIFLTSASLWGCFGIGQGKRIIMIDISSAVLPDFFFLPSVTSIFDHVTLSTATSLSQTLTAWFHGDHVVFGDCWGRLF